MANSINTNIAAYYAQANITAASLAASSSVARLSSGNRIVQASDDVAALATGTSLLTTVSALRSAQTNASQGTSLLQVADGALAQIQSILQQQKSIALQAGSGSLTNTDRGFLNQQFQALAQEIDILATSTTFNGVALLNGSLSTGASIADSTTLATAASATITLNSNAVDANTFLINGLTLVAKDTVASTLQFQIGATAAETVNNLAAKLTSLSQTYDSNNYQNSLGQAIFTANGNQLVITSRTGGSLGENFYIDTTGTATITKGVTAGNFGGSTVTVFATGFASATSSLTDSSHFANGESITARIGGTAKTLYTVATDDTLTDIVNGINSNAATTGVTARLTFDAANPATGYNLVLGYEDTTRPLIVNFGASFAAGSNTVNGVANTVGTSGSYVNSTSEFVFGAKSLTLFHTALTTANITDSNQTVATATFASVAAALPFFVGDRITATLYNSGQSATVGQTVTLHTIAAGNDLNDIIAGINANYATTGYYAVGTGTTGGSNFQINLFYSDPTNVLNADTGVNTHSTAAEHTNGAQVTAGTTARTLSVQQKFGLAGGEDNGLGFSSVSVSGAVTDALVTTLSTTVAKASINFPDIAAAALQDAGNFNSDGSVYLTVGGKNFGFTTNAANVKASDEITIGDTLQETLDNAVDTINEYLSSGQAYGGVAYQLNQIKVTRQGNSLIFEGKDLNNVTAIGGGAATAIAISAGFTAGATIGGSATLANAARSSSTAEYGVDISGVNNADFTGTIKGFTASYISPNVANLSVKVGNYTYNATNVTTNPSANQTIRFYSETLANGTNGGFFDVQLAKNQGNTVASQVDANAYALRLNAAFSGLDFLQERVISSYNPTQTIVANGVQTGSLIGSKVSAQLAGFNANKLTDVSITAAPANGDAKITLTIDGETFSTATGIGSALGANQTYRLTSTTDSTHYVDFTTGSTSIELNTSAAAKAAQDAIAEAFGANEGSAALSFQIGATVSDTLSVRIGSAKTTSIYGGETLNVATQADAAHASAVLDDAIASVTALRAGVGALESQFAFASAALQSGVQNQDAARGQLLDTDIAVESTLFATAQVKLQAGISVLAQANQQLQALLKLIG